MAVLVIIPLLATILIFLVIFSQEKVFRYGMRHAWIISVLLCCLFLAATTELLSAFHGLTLFGVCVVWGILILSYAIYLSVNRPRQKIVSLFSQRVKSVLKKRLALAVIFLTTISLAISLLYPPNNYDSMTYHMARVAHWVQQHSIYFYQTHIGRQLVFPPFAEWIILHLQLLTGTDLFANAVQWFFYLQSIIIVSLIAKEFGANGRQQLNTAFFAAVIPMAVMQSNTTQNDLVASFFICAFVYFTILLMKKEYGANAIAAGISLGLAWLTKTTAYIFVLPFIIWYAADIFRNWRVNKKLPLQLTVRYLTIGLFAVVINLGFYYRNISAAGTVFISGGVPISNEAHKAAPLAIVALKNLMNHIPVNTAIKGILIHKSQQIGADANDPHYSYVSTWNMAEGYPLDEDHAQNLMQVLLVPMFLFLVWRRRRVYKISGQYVAYIASIFAGAFLFCISLKWQPWSNRLETPLFVLLAVMMGIETEFLSKTIQRIILLIVFIPGVIALLFSKNHPLLPISKSIFENERNSFIYSRSMRNCATYINSLPIKRIGLIVGGDDWDYPFYGLLSENAKRELEHVLVENASAKYGVPFSPEIIISTDTTKQSYSLGGFTFKKMKVFDSKLAVFAP